MNTYKLNKICKLAKDLKCEVFFNEPLSHHSTFRIGGKAEVFIRPNKLSQLKAIIKCCNEDEIKYVIIGNGSNILFKDERFEGAVINISSRMEDISIENETEIKVSAGTTLAKLAYFAMKNSLTGLEFCFGIPGTVGGAVFMNAGAYDKEIKDVIISSSYIDKNGNEGILLKDEMNFGYRYSGYRDNGYIITEARFDLSFGDKKEIKANMDSLMERRRSKQPLDLPNVGSIFKRPKGNFAGTLIQECGLKGKAIGGAMVSEKHAGFIVNTGGATARDVIELINFVRKEVFEKTGYDLEPEVRII